jgi:hypothetical protein
MTRTPTLLRPLLAALLPLALAACSDEPTADEPDMGSLDAPPDAATSPDLPGTSCSLWTPSVPQSQRGEGTVMRDATVVPVYFANHDGAAVTRANNFLVKYVNSTVWNAQLGEYGLGKTTVGSAVHLKESAPATTTQAELASYLYNKFAQNTTELGPADSSILYVIYYPATTRFGRDGQTGCADFGGFHAELASADGTPVAYAVVLDCNQGDSTVTVTASHEIIEGLTDPFPESSPTYRDLQPAYRAWSVALQGTELGDLCEHSPDSFVVDPDIGAYQRIWSNRAAAAHQNPCVPVPRPPAPTSTPAPCCPTRCPPPSRAARR